MKALTPEIARHCFPLSIYPLLEHAGIIGLPFEKVARFGGTWMTSYGFDGPARFDDQGRLTSMGNHLGVVYNDPIEMVLHRAGNSVRLRINREEQVSKVAVGPHCCAKFSAVHRHTNGRVTSESIHHRTGRTETLFLDEKNRITEHKTDRSTIQYFYNDDDQGPVYSRLKELNRETKYVLDMDTRFPVRLEVQDTEAAHYEIIREATDSDIDHIRKGRVMYIASGQTVLLDFSKIWTAIDMGDIEWPEFEARWGDII